MVRLTPPFGALLKQLRKQSGMTQRDLAAALGYSKSLICSLENAQRQPDLQAVTERFIPALGLQDDPQTAAMLIEQAALARGERPPTSVIVQRTTQVPVHAEHRQAQLAGPVDALPPLPTQLLGRTAEVNQLCNRMLGHTGRLLTLTGPPGVGKTTLALAMVARLQPYYRDGVVFVPLAAINDPGLMAATIAAAVGSYDASSKPPKTRLIEFLRHKTTLLVLDNLEQLLSPPLSGFDVSRAPQAPATGREREGTRGGNPMGAGVGLIAALIAECPHLSILATSRERLHLRAEQRYKVPPLDLSAAVALFTHRAQMVDVDFNLTLHNQPIVEAICTRLDRLPLALELCAAQIDLLSPAQLLKQLQARALDLLVDGAHDLPPQHRTLRSAIQRSYDLLADDERVLLRCLGVFAGGFDLAAVEQVSAWEQATQTRSLFSVLHGLIAKSLVRSETLPSGEQRFLLLETIREFAAEQLTISGEAALLRQRHFATYLHFARTVDHKVRGPDAVRWFARLSLEQDNLRAAWQWALDTHHFVDAAWLGVALCHTWFMRAHWYEGAQWLEQLLPHRHELVPHLRLALLLTLYRFWRALQNFPAIEQYGYELSHLRETCPAPLLRAAAWFYLAVSLPNPADSVAAFNICLALLDEAAFTPAISDEFCFFADGVHLQAMALIRYAIRLTDEVGEYAQAEQLSQESLRLFQTIENRDFIAYALGNLGRLALMRSDVAQAQHFFHQAVTIATTVGNGMSLGDWQPRLGIVTFYAGDSAEGRRLLDESLNACLDLGNVEILARIYGYLAEIALSEGDLTQAEAWATQSMGHQAKLRWLTVEFVDFLFIAARLATAQQAYRCAAMRFGLAEQIRSRIGYLQLGPMRAQIDTALATVRAALDPAVFAEAFAAGQQMALEDAFATLLTSDRVEK